MDPLESVRQYREQEHGGGRVVTIAPPPVLAPRPTPELQHGAEIAPTPAPFLETPTPQSLDGADLTPTEAEAETKIPGTARGRKQLLHLYLPNATSHLLDGAREGHGSLGAAAMAALRGSYEHIVEHHTPEPAEAVGPFPAPRPPRRRLVVDDARMKTVYVDPGEAAAIEQLANQCELSLSELVTIAVDNYFGEQAPPPNSPPRRRDE